MGHLGHPGSDDLFLAVVRYAPLLFVVAGVLTIWWLSRLQLPGDVQPDVLAALSDTEALPPGTIRQRLPLGTQSVDADTLVRVLDALCTDGLAVRWYEEFEAPGPGRERQAVYRRVSQHAR